MTRVRHGLSTETASTAAALFAPAAVIKTLVGDKLPLVT